MAGFDHESYLEYYKQIIVPVIEDYCQKDYGIIVKTNAEEIIWHNYVKFMRHCREEYMQDPEKLADRHKIVACYIFAILKSNLLTSSLSQEYGDEKHLLLNERLAFCFGMTLLRALIRGNANQLSNQDIKKAVLKAFNDELLFPQTNHGIYKDNFLLQLYYTKKEGNYNILALANSLYLIESYNLIYNNLPTDIFKK